MKPIRNSAKAVIINNDRVLLTKNEDDRGFFYLCPGGGQEKGEALQDTVVRECLEEAGCQVLVMDLLFVREYIGKNHEFSEWDREVHQVEFYFECVTEDAVNLSNGYHPDEHQVGVEWVEVDKLHEIRVYPSVLAERIKEGRNGLRYLGDRN